jgi:hypothetical protein
MIFIARRIDDKTRKREMVFSLDNMKRGSESAHQSKLIVQIVWGAPRGDEVWPQERQTTDHGSHVQGGGPCGLAA